MGYPVNRPHSEVSVSTHMADLSTASTAYLVAPFRGRLRRCYTVIANAITGADSVVTIKVRGTSTGKTITVANTSSAAGDVDSVDLGYLGTTNFVSEGDLIEFVTDGASSTTCITRCVAVIDRVN